MTTHTTLQRLEVMSLQQAASVEAAVAGVFGGGPCLEFSLGLRA